jgi:hypothetical protein
MIREDHVARMTDDKCIQSFGRKTWTEEATWKNLEKKEE